MSGEKKEMAGVPEKTKHQNIFEALSAFQGENPEIKRTKKVDFTAGSRKIEFWYSPLDEILNKVRPLLAENGLSVTWEEKGENKIVCALYHETYEVENLPTEEAFEVSGTIAANKPSSKKYARFEKNVIRSMPITVRRNGDMKDIGADSTYARRYTLAEVLGIASDEDLDAGFDEARGKQLENFAFTKAKEGIQKAKTIDALMTSAGFIDKDLKAIEEGKVPALGLKKEQYQELLKLLGERKIEIKKSFTGLTGGAGGAGGAGGNQNANGTAGSAGGGASGGAGGAAGTSDGSSSGGGGGGGGGGDI